MVGRSNATGKGALSTPGYKELPKSSIMLKINHNRIQCMRFALLMSSMI